MVEWSALLLRIWNVLDSNLGLESGYPDRIFFEVNSRDKSIKQRNLGSPQTENMVEVKRYQYIWKQHIRCKI
jgi:hypothetical protein